MLSGEIKHKNHNTMATEAGTSVAALAMVQ